MSVTRHRLVPWMLALTAAAAACSRELEPPRADGSPDAVAAPPEPSPPDPPAPQPRPIAPEDRPIVDAHAALQRGEGDAVVRAYEELLQSGTPKQRDAARTWLPVAYVAAGDPDRAALRVTEFLEGAPHDVAAWLHQLRGDVECARGDTDAAIRFYRALPRTMTAEKQEETLGYTALLESGAKLALVGRNLPDLTPAWFVGKPPGDITRRIVVLTFFSPYGPDCGAVAMAKRLAALPDPPLVVGVVPTDADEHVPRPFELSEEEWPKPEKNTLEATEAWRKRYGAEFPVIGVSPKSVPADLILFHNCVVADAGGSVVYVGTQSGPAVDAVTRAVLRRLAGR